MIGRRSVVAGVFGAAASGGLATWSRRGRAATSPLRLGVLNDMSGVYADYQGPGSVIAAQLAAADGAGLVDRPIEILAGDHKNQPDIGLSIARKWFDTDGVDAILDVPNSAIALGVADLCRQRNKVLLASGAGTSDLTGPKCAPTTVQWTYDNWSLGHSLGRALLAQGAKTWFLITADYAFGYDLSAQLRDAVAEGGGRVLGEVRAPLGTSDFSSYLLQAQAAKPDVLALCNAGGDITTALKQASEFGLAKQMKLAGPVVNVNVVVAVGLPQAQGLLAVTPFYWDRDDATRAFARRYAARQAQHAMPNDMQAGVYAATMHYLKAVHALGGDSTDGAAVVAAMKRMPTDDPLFGRGAVRQDGRVVHPVYLMRTKTPAESHGTWDVFEQVGVVPADQAYRPLAAGKCPLVGS